MDAVASMLYLDYSREEGQWQPNRFGGRENLEAISFLQEVNATVYKTHPGAVMIAEESTAFPGVTAPTSQGGLGFGIKWNMGWMHDSLKYISEDPFNRRWHHGTITFSMVYAYTENFLLPISHDEVVHGKGSMLRKMPGDRWQQLANLRAFLGYQWAHPGKQLIFMGTEFGQEAEWSEQHGLDWWLAEIPAHRGMQLLTKDLNELYSSTPALYEQDNDPAGFQWINGGDSDRNVLTFIRRDAAGNPLVCAFNFSGGPHTDFRLGVPVGGGVAGSAEHRRRRVRRLRCPERGHPDGHGRWHRRPAGHAHRHAAPAGRRVLQAGELTPGPLPRQRPAEHRRRARNPRDSGLFGALPEGAPAPPLSPGQSGGRVYFRAAPRS